MSQSQRKETAPLGFDDEGWPLPEVRSMMVDNFTRSWFKHWIATITIFCVAFFLIMFSAMLVDPRWAGTASLELNPEPEVRISGGTDAILGDAEPVTVAARVKTITEQLTDRQLLSQVSEELDLPAYFERRANEEATWRTRIKKRLAAIATLRFIRGGGDVNWETKALEELESRWIVAAPLEGTVRIEVQVLGDTPEMTVMVGNTLLETLIVERNEDRRAQVQRHVQWLTDQVKRAEENLRGTEAQILAARQDLGVYNATAAAEQTGTTLIDLRQQRSTMPLQMDQLEAQVSKLEEELSATPEFIQLARAEEGSSTGPTVQSLEATVARARSELDGLRTRISATAPEVRQKEAEVRSLEAELARLAEMEGRRDRTGSSTITEINRKYQNLWDRWQEALVQLTVLQARASGLDSVITQLETEQRQAIAADVELQRLNRQQREQEAHVVSLRQQMVGFETLANQERLRNDLVINPAMTVANTANADYPNMLLAFILALAMATFAALVLPVAYDYLNQTMLSSRQATAIPGLRLVAVVPSMRTSSMFKPASS